MNLQGNEPGWKQHFPTYHFTDEEVALEEYRSATKTLEAEERVFLNAANLGVAVAAVLGSLALGALERLAATFTPVVPEWMTLTFLLLLAGGFSVLALRYFADRHKAVVFAARKVIVLRRMLGMSYGSLQLVLPNWRIEGADEPFAIRMFPGWNTYVAYPCFAIAGISAALVMFVLASLFNQLVSSEAHLPFAPLPLVIGTGALWFSVLAWTYRKALLDTHERTTLLIAAKCAKALRVSLVRNIEQVIYRATLSTYEMQRIGMDLSKIKELLIHIEDKEFYTHPGVSIKGIARLLRSILRQGRRAGGSTITQQLVRTLFIIDQKKLVRRKLIEILLALWVNSVCSKARQLEMYLASVRFESGIFGVPAATKYFFSTLKTHLSAAEAFFLIERVSNVRSLLLVEKIDQTLRAAVNANVLSTVEARQAVDLYARAVEEGKVLDRGAGIQRLKAAWRVADEGG